MCLSKANSVNNYISHVSLLLLTEVIYESGKLEGESEFVSVFIPFKQLNLPSDRNVAQTLASNGYV